MKTVTYLLLIFFVFSIFNYVSNDQLISSDVYADITQHPTPEQGSTSHISAGGKSDGWSSSSSSGLNNIAPQSNLSWNNYGLVDGNRDCACVNNGSFGPGWNPGEKIIVMFNDYVNIGSIALYLGCSPQHREVASGIIRYVDQWGNIVHFGEFYHVGYVNNNGLLSFHPSIVTRNLEIEMTSGGGNDRNICFSELEIFTSF